MADLEELKERIGKEASEEPEKFFAVEKIKENGFVRGKCRECGKHFWSVKDRDICGEPACGEGYTFINDPPTDKEFSFETGWTKFKEFMEDRGYTAINRYPIAARWRNDTDFVRASIYDFQPYVVSGQVEPPANPLVVPQFCVRFNDIDNVGITGRHYTGFIMTGQHAFTSAESYDQDKYFKDMLEWVIKGMGIPKEKIVLHEDTWGGGGNLGACMEFFVDGLELFNQVYMFYKVDESDSRGYSELDTKVLDMGLGHERIVWITHGTQTSYEANMPGVVEKLYQRTGVEPDKDIWRKFLPYSGLLNFDEVVDIEDTWEEIAESIGVEKEELKEEIMPAAALYSIADHTRSLLVALVDGILPSNTGEKHSLRLIARRALNCIDKYGWDLDLADVMEWHAEEMKGVFPELKENLEQAQRIIRHEEQKYREMRKRAEKIVEKLDEEDLSEEKMIDLYDSEGISPELLQHLGLEVDIPQDFYSKVAARHEEEGKQEHATEKEEKNFEVSDLPKTDFQFRKDERQREFEAKVVKVFEKNGKSYLVLDRTCFYPTSGGQMHDTGEIAGEKVTDVFKQEGVVIHEVDGGGFEEGEDVQGSIDWDRRRQLMKHHTATHLINGATKEVLGNHVWQAGTKKTVEKARLDVTHYKDPTEEELDRIQELANQWIEKDLPVEKRIMEKSGAERKYGFIIYQGGAPPGNSLRVVTIGENKDIEACGGTHVDSTSEVEEVVIVGVNKVQDGVYRLEFKAGEAAREFKQYRKNLEKELKNWIDTENYHLGDVADIFDTEIDNLPAVVSRFVDEWDSQREDIWELESLVEEGIDHTYDEKPRDPRALFNEWKKQKKDIQRLEEQIEKNLKKEFIQRDSKYIKEEIPIDDVGTLIRIAKHVTSEEEDNAVVLKGKNAVIAAQGEDSDRDLESEVERLAEVVQGSGDFVKGFKLKRGVEL